MKTAPLPSKAARVLFVDDSEQDFRLMKLMVESDARNNYSFDWVKDSNEAAKQLHQEDYDLVDVDYNLGLEIGTEVIDKLSDQRPDLAYILVTANQDKDVYKRGVEAGASNFVPKGGRCGEAFDRAAQYSMQRKQKENSVKIANSSKDWLLGLLEHDICHPLAALNQLLMTVATEGQNMPKEMLLEMAETAYRSSSETLLATRGLLDWSRSVHSYLSPRFKLIDISNIIRKTIHLITPISDEHGIYIHFLEGERQLCQADPEMLSAVVRNVILSGAHLCASNENLDISVTSSGSKLVFQASFVSKPWAHGTLDLMQPTNQNDIQHASCESEVIKNLRLASHLLDCLGSQLDIVMTGGDKTTLKFALKS